MIHWVVNLDCDKTRPGRDPKILGTNTHWPVATALWLPNPNIELENSWLLKTVSWFSKYVLCAFKLASRYQEGTFLFLEASFIFLFPDIEIEWCSAVHCMNIEEGLLHVVRKTDCQIDISIIMIPATSKMGQKKWQAKRSLSSRLYSDVPLFPYTILAYLMQFLMQIRLKSLSVL